MNKLIVAIALNTILSGFVFAETISCPNEIYYDEKGLHYKNGERIGTPFPYWKTNYLKKPIIPTHSNLKLKAYYPITIIADEFKNSGIEFHCEYKAQNKSTHSYLHVFLTTSISQVTGNGWSYIYYDTPRKEHKMMAKCNEDPKTPIEAKYADYKNCLAIN
jgi:hypothetical protein